MTSEEFKAALDLAKTIGENIGYMKAMKQMYTPNHIDGLSGREEELAVRALNGLEGAKNLCPFCNGQMEEVDADKHRVEVLIECGTCGYQNIFTDNRNPDEEIAAFLQHDFDAQDRQDREEYESKRYEESLYPEGTY